MKSSNDVTELLFWLLQSSSENDTIAPRYPDLVLRIPSHIQILKTFDAMSFDRMRRTTLPLNDNNAYWVRQGEYTFTVTGLTN